MYRMFVCVFAASCERPREKKRTTTERYILREDVLTIFMHPSRNTKTRSLKHRISACYLVRECLYFAAHVRKTDDGFLERVSPSIKDF